MASSGPHQYYLAVLISVHDNSSGTYLSTRSRIVAEEYLSAPENKQASLGLPQVPDQPQNPRTHKLSSKRHDVGRPQFQARLSVGEGPGV